MPGIVMDGIQESVLADENGNSATSKENPAADNSTPKGNQNGNSAENVKKEIETSIDQLYENVCDMQSSDRSPSRPSFGSEGDESRIDSELRHLAGGEMKEVEIIEQDEDLQKAENVSKKDSTLPAAKPDNSNPRSSRRASHSSPKSKIPAKTALRPAKIKTSPMKPQDGLEDPLDNPDLGPFLLKQARDLMSSNDNPRRALDLATRAAKSFEKCAGGQKPTLDLVMCLHVSAAIHCALGQYAEAIPILERSIEIPDIEAGPDHALAKFAGHMQLGDTYSMLGQLGRSILSYSAGLEIQRRALGENDPRVGETCRYLAEAHIQAMQFDEAQHVCQLALDIHRGTGLPASLEEAADRRLMGMICEAKGDPEGALEHLVLASMAMAGNGQESEVGPVDCSIGDAYLSLNRYDEAVFAYQKALTSLKSARGESHPAVAYVYVRLADLYNRTGKFRDSRSYCENALRIFEKPSPGTAPEEVAGGLADISAIYDSMGETERALKLLQRALRIYKDAPGQQSTVAGIEAQMGVMYYVLGKYSESYSYLRSAVEKLRASGEKKSAFFGIALNQMGLTCVQRYAINEALELFEEAKVILEKECGPWHPDTLGVYSNLAGTYDAVGR
ncbi:tetratricopeptide repeat protein [Striga asiatica]|uniref:Tetratricopeptide repeat protein n=1 Tax=Striga asiatica TaxID=4170 RepID=A0A5A7R9B8_STRAF|nr:tetratricopeptide repeat protein [Striga asiatica]